MRLAIVLCALVALANAELYTVIMDDGNADNPYLFNHSLLHVGISTPVLNAGFLRVKGGDQVKFITKSGSDFSDVILKGIDVDAENKPTCNSVTGTSIDLNGLAMGIWTVPSLSTAATPELAIFAIEVNASSACNAFQAVFIIHDDTYQDQTTELDLKMAGVGVSGYIIEMEFSSKFQNGISMKMGETLSLTIKQSIALSTVSIGYSNDPKACPTNFEEATTPKISAVWEFDPVKYNSQPGVYYFFAKQRQGAGSPTDPLTDTCVSLKVGKLTITGEDVLSSSTIGATSPSVTTVTTTTAANYTNTTTTTTTTQAEESSDDLSTGAIVGIAVGSGLAFVLLVVFIVYIVRSSRSPSGFSGPETIALNDYDPTLIW